MPDSVRQQRLLALFTVGWAQLNNPLLTLWDRDATVGGIPLLAVALFTGWAILIGDAAWVAEAGPVDR
jgi:hypothetical protein